MIMAPPDHLILDSIAKTRPDGSSDIFDLTVKAGEIIALLGTPAESKALMLRLIAGFEIPSSGTILLDGQRIDTLPPEQRGIAMAASHDTLFPALNLRDNLTFKAKSSRRRDAVTRMMRLDQTLNQYPHQVARSDRQSTVLARALLRPAPLHLFNNPFDDLSPALRLSLRRSLKPFLREHEITAIINTGDQAEATAWADRIAILADGVIRQCDTPAALRAQPVDLAAATLIGMPPMNIYPARLDVADRIGFTLGKRIRFDFDMSALVPTMRGALAHAARQSNVLIGIRPDAFQRAENGLNAHINVNQWLGDVTHLVLNLGGEMAIMVDHQAHHDRPGSSIQITMNPAGFHVFDATSGKALLHGHAPTEPPSP